MVRYERLELPDQLLMSPEFEVGLDPQLKGGGSQFVQSCPVASREFRVGEVGQRCPSPERQTLSQYERGRFG